MCVSYFAHLAITVIVCFKLKTIEEKINDVSEMTKNAM